MYKKLCDKCKNEIKCGVRLDGGEPYPGFYSIRIRKFTGEGVCCNADIEYHLCEKCYDEVIGFLSYKDNSNSHVDTNPAYKANQYVIGLKEDQDKTILIGKEMNTNDAIPNSIQVGVGLKGIKSILKCGNIYWYTTKIFSRFQKKMWKLFFGVEIQEI